MLKMINLTEILLYKFRDNWSSYQISEETNYSRTTIRRYLKKFSQFKDDYSQNHSKLLSLSELIEEFVFQYLYSTPVIRRRVMTDEVIQIIDNCIKDNEVKRLTGLKKQRMLKEDIYQFLLDKGFNLSYSSVCKYITNNYGKNITECFIKQQYELGYTSEFDWGEVKLYINNRLRTFRMGAFAMAGSNTRWGQLFQHENTLSFQEAHVNFFKYMKGVSYEVLYDNMKVAVKRLAGDKKPTTSLLNLMNHYHFKHRFCNIRRGNEKGAVERSVEYLRRKAFCIKDHFNSIEEANTYLYQCFDKLNKIETNISLFQKERESLLSYSSDYQCSFLEKAKIDKLSTFCYDYTHYSVPDYLIGRVVDIKIYSDKIKIYYNKKEICRHDRCYSHSWIMNLNHYLLTLYQKPGALKNSVSFHQAPNDLRDIYNKYFINNSKDFIELLLYIENIGLNYKSIYDAINTLKTKNICKINAYLIRSILDNKSNNASNFNNINCYTNITIDDENIRKYTISDISKLTSSITSLNN